MKKILVLVVILALLLTVFYFLKNEDTNTVQSDSSKVVNVYSSRNESLIKHVFELFTKETGIKVNYLSDDAKKLVSRMKSEGKHSDADLFLSADVLNLSFAQNEDLLQPVSSEILESRIPENLRNGYWFALTCRTRLIIYAKDRVDPSEIKNYEDLSNPRWKDRLLFRSSNSPYNQSLLASMIFANGLPKVQKWVKGVVRNMARPPYGGDTDQIKGVASGEGDVAIANSYYIARILATKDGALARVADKIGIIFPNQDNRGAMVNISGAGVTKYAKNKENAIKLLEFMVSDAVQEIYANSNHEYPVVSTVEKSKILKEWGEYKFDTTNLEEITPYMSVAVQLADENGWK